MLLSLYFKLLIIRITYRISTICIANKPLPHLTSKRKRKIKIKIKKGQLYGKINFKRMKSEDRFIVFTIN